MNPPDNPLRDNPVFWLIWLLLGAAVIGGLATLAIALRHADRQLPATTTGKASDSITISRWPGWRRRTASKSTIISRYRRRPVLRRRCAMRPVIRRR